MNPITAFEKERDDKMTVVIYTNRDDKIIVFSIFLKSKFSFPANFAPVQIKMMARKILKQIKTRINPVQASMASNNFTF